MRGPPRCSGPGARRPAALGVGDWGREGGNERAGVPGIDTFDNESVRASDLERSEIYLRH